MKWTLILIAVFALSWFLSFRKHRNIFNTQTENKENNKRKILDFLNTKHQFNNTDIENLLSVSDATATRYLDELEKEQKVKQVGRTGKHVYYEKV
jgi:Fic family protein